MENSATEIQKTLSKHLKVLNSVYRLSKQVSRLLGNWESELNLKKLRGTIEQMEKLLESLKEEAGLIESIEGHIKDVKSRIERLESHLKARFGQELEKEMKSIGLKLEGHYPELKAGLFTIEPDFLNYKVVIWYGPKQERLGTVSLSPSKVAQKIREIRSSLGSKLDKEEFLKKLREAYTRASKGKKDVPVPILYVMKELAFLLQPPAFHIDPRKENYKSYGRADFSYDLFRLSDVHNIKLVTATRAFTKSRAKFLWIPRNESGEGATYSHLTFREDLGFK